ncbi:spore germination protein [Ornithinibacillus sp. 4-3]|uniref:Spore germination protein n=1 Tax=Ornithinibacillus sp. 4-3 TaxID=3231488 RepID=A0AB39HR50_9BACI
MNQKRGTSAEQSSELETYGAEKAQQEWSRETLQGLFEKSADVIFQDFTFGEQKVLFITCDAMIDQQMLHSVVVERISKFIEQMKNDDWDKTDILEQLHVPGLKEILNKQQLITSVYEGSVILWMEGKQSLFSANIAHKPNRTPEETKTEITVKGPRDNFIEDLATNVALIRKRLPTNSLCVEKYQLGRRTKTEVSIMYFDDMANPKTINTIREKIEAIDVDIIFSTSLLMEHIDKTSRLFPRHDYTGRPDYVVQSLARGRIVILMDGVSYAVITPVNLFLLFKTSEDNEYPVIYGSFERLLRLSGVLIGTLFPAFWLALMTFHQDQLPLFLLATIVQSSLGLPFPALLEMLLMLLMFELFREAGLRLPESIGGTLSVVGGLIIGDAAIRAGITSPAMIVVIAISTIATFTLVNQSLVTAVSVVRFGSILLTGLLGLFGFFMSFYFLLVYLAGFRIFGAPYLEVAEQINWTNIKKTFLRPLQKDFYKRPEELRSADKIRANNTQQKEEGQ